MSSTSEITERAAAAAAEPIRPPAVSAGASSWALWTRQTLAILRLEIGKNFFSRRALLLYLIAASPLGLLSLFALFRMPTDNGGRFSQLSVAYAAIYGGLILRTLVFFGCAWVFMNLFRGEVVDRSLHYYFLAPVRRELLVVGKYLSGLIATTVLFSVTTVGSMLILYFSLYPSESARYFLEGAGAGQLLAYLGVTILACIGYGAVFLLVGLFFRNPIIPGLLLYGWEWINFLLPPLLKKISVIHYLQSLVPVPMSEGPFAVLVEPTPAWISVPSLLVFTGVVLFLASLHIRRMEISYAGD
jgi:ABC-type transport system involved in multi-copper enzyme maturation permease subunit